MYQNILFDLDGTLVNSEEGITKSVSYSLAKFGIKEDPKNLTCFIGPPLFSSFSMFYGFSEEKAVEAVSYYREYYSEFGVHMNRVYDGMENLLKKLKAEGKTIILATSKYEYYAKKILEEIGFAKYFDFAAGSLADGARSEKKEVIAHILQTMHIEDLSNTVMIGDRKHDIIGANEIGIDSIGVLYGFGSKEELSSYGATYIANDMDEIFRIIIN